MADLREASAKAGEPSEEPLEHVIDELVASAALAQGVWRKVYILQKR